MKGLVRVIAGIGLVCASTAIFADTLKVGPNERYKTIQAALNSAKKTDTISVAVGTYTENITLSADLSGITLTGAETARTLLKATNDLKPVITISGVTSGRISNFTFIESTTGIKTDSASAVIITANVFNLGVGSGTAMHVSDAADKSTIANNTFYANKAAVLDAASSTVINNNIFVLNTTAIANAHANTGISANQFFKNEANGSVGTNAVINVDGDTDAPSFVAPTIRDFHSKKAEHSDRGAYSGTYCRLKAISRSEG